tara:strand:+ start:312 stop:629 length:318 start_codon:yes stop_codon:yes gene_type:complete
MKKFILLLIVTVLFVFGCGNKKDKVNSWSQKDRNSFIDQCETMQSFIVVLQALSEEDYSDYCICCLGVAQQKWPNLKEADKASMNLSMKDFEELYADCAKQHLDF